MGQTLTIGTRRQRATRHDRRRGDRHRHRDPAAGAARAGGPRPPAGGRPGPGPLHRFGPGAARHGAADAAAPRAGAACPSSAPGEDPRAVLADRAGPAAPRARGLDEGLDALLAARAHPASGTQRRPGPQARVLGSEDHEATKASVRRRARDPSGPGTLGCKITIEALSPDPQTSELPISEASSGVSSNRSMQVSGTSDTATQTGRFQAVASTTPVYRRAAVRSSPYPGAS